MQIGDLVIPIKGQHKHRIGKIINDHQTLKTMCGPDNYRVRFHDGAERTYHEKDLATSIALQGLTYNEDQSEIVMDFLRELKGLFQKFGANIWIGTYTSNGYLTIGEFWRITDISYNPNEDKPKATYGFQFRGDIKNKKTVGI